MIKKKISVYQQTQALLYKNFLKKWRMKKEMNENHHLVLCCLCCFFMFTFHRLPPRVLGRVDEFNDSDLVVAYTPVTNMTQRIIDKMSLASKTIGVADKEMMDTVLLESHHEMVGVVFNDTFSYQLKLNWAYGFSIAEEHSEYSEHCWDMHDDIFCYVARYWQNGFVAFQTAINAAIIELTTNHSVMETLTSVTGINMRMPSFVSKGEVINTWFIFICIVYFSPFVYSTSLNVTKERKKHKKLMAVMGLRESAFWLSWGLMYAGFVFILSIAMALIITLSKTVVIVGFLVIVTLFVLYGLSLIALAFLLSVLIKKPVLTSLVGFLFTTFWGCLGFTVLYRQLPSSLGWILSLFSPFAFTAGMAQISHMDYYLMGITFPDPSGESHVMMVTFFILALDTLLYLILMLYFERALPDEGGHPCSPLFFLKSSFWSQHRNTHHEVFEDEINPEHYPDDSFEPVPLEFHGKEAIRIRNIRKEYDGKPEKVALQGIFLDIYEGQVTAILGHNGAGKSTLLNILSGLSVPTKGSATIYNTQLSEITNMEETRMNIGFCPQFNIQFDFLTVRENLRLFAKIKGIQSKEVEQEVKRVIMELDIQNTQDVIAKKLTGGQKRKLTLGIALLGDPQVLLLDEPTTGLDPFSKHQVWNLLKERKTNRVILFSTQIMDEADILADRKVFLSNGKLKCAGSSLFLKQKWGIGYHLSLHRNEMCNLERITSLIKRHVPDAKLRAESEEKLVYLLPLERTNKFPDLYRDLEKCSNQGIMNYDVSMTTLNEVFLNLEGKSTIDEPGIIMHEKVDETRDAGTESEMQEAPCSLPGLRKAISTRTLWRRQVCAMARLRFLKLRHERKLLLSLLLLLGIPLIPTIVVKIVVALSHSTHCRELSSSMYFLSLEQPSQTPLTSLLVINNTGSNIEDFMQALKRQDILLEVDDFRNRNGSDDPSYNGAIIVSGDRKDYRFSVVCNTKRITCFPVLMGIVSNALLGIFNFTELIKTERSTFPFNGVLVEFGFVNGPLFLLVLANCLSPYIGMSSFSDRKVRGGSQLWISGLCPSAYWIGQALVDIPLYCSILLSVYLMNCFMVLEVVCIVGCAASLIFFTYVISFIFRKRRKNNGLWCLGFLIVSIYAYISTCCGWLLCIFECMFVCLFVYLFYIIFLFVIRCLEMKYGQKTMRKDPVFSRENHPNPEEPEEEDENVQAERARTANALTTLNPDEKPLVVASCLHKEYKEKKEHCFSTRKKKIAIRNISFCVNKGEVLGLLGHNGAGKSTSIKMVTGDTKPTAGTVRDKQPEDDTVKFLGYCPQENSLWPGLTGKDHVELYAAVKGMSKQEAALSTSRLVEAFKLQEQLKVPVKDLSQEVKRKLCFALSVLGDPSVVLLDEPSTGVDPEGQQQMWQAIQTIVKNTEKGVLLTTHSMAEAEAVCDRVAIMVSGKLRCIGSIQNLKSKFGKDYILEVKIKDPTQVEPVHMEILKLFPQAARQERYSSMMAYKLPVEAVRPLSQAFFKLEAVKQTFDLEEYSLSQATLEQVFLELSKEQELGNLDDEVDTTVRWKLLPQEEP
uniref:ATP binding cassette subfamily A member 10 n=1 Tax=Panthera leo TaxID=9689 RepID=A0A8C8X224_PANLE